MELGIATFVDTDPAAGAAGARQRLRELVEQAELAEQVGLDVVAVGEHHRADFAVSAPAVVLSALAERTSRVRLSSAVTVLSSDDPVRVYQDFATLDLLSGGRAEIMAGRGSFTESFPLFGQDLEDYDELFASKLDLLLAVRSSERVTWSGPHRAPLVDAGVYPRALAGSAAGVDRRGRDAAVGRAGGDARAAADDRDHRRGAGAVRAAGRRCTARRSRRAARRALALPPIGINSHTYVAEDCGAGRGRVLPALRRDDEPDRARARAGRRCRGCSSTSCGRRAAPCWRAGRARWRTKILYEHELFGHQRFLAQMSVGGMPHEKVMRSIELFGTEVAPVVRAEVERREAEAAAGPDVGLAAALAQRAVRRERGRPARCEK